MEASARLELTQRLHAEVSRLMTAPLA